MAESRELRREILHKAVEGFLDHLEEDFDANSEYGNVGLSHVVISAAIYTSIEAEDGDGVDETTVPTWYSTNEDAIWRRGFFELLADYHRIRGELR
jgi:hypothetical protein